MIPRVIYSILTCFKLTFHFIEYRRQIPMKICIKIELKKYILLKVEY